MRGPERIRLDVDAAAGGGRFHVAQFGENLLGGSIDLWVTGNAGDSLSRIQLGTGGLADRI
ncbi:MAG: hypothetical protein J7515_08285, partial [Caulobacter sp.]|nr:hypothetical protein [Caulobacter sp.]